MKEIDFSKLDLRLFDDPLRRRIKDFLTAGFGPWANVALLLLFAFIMALVWYGVHPTQYVSSDVEDYYNTWFSFVDRTWTGVRTPVYPIFIGIPSWLFGVTVGAWVVVALQTLIHFSAAFCFYELCRLVRIPRKLIFFAIAGWILLPIATYTNYDAFILTESLCSSMLVFMTYTTVLYICRGKVKSMVWSLLWLFLLVFLRPGNMFLFPLLLVVFVVDAIIRKHNRLNDLFGIVGVAAIIGLMSWYGEATRKLTGTSNVTYIAIFNNYCLLYHGGYNEPANIEDPSLRERFAQFLAGDKQGYPTQYSFFCELDPRFVQLEKYVDKGLAQHPEMIKKALIDRIPEYLTYPTTSSVVQYDIHPTVWRFTPRIWISLAILLLAFGYNLITYKRNAGRAVVSIWIIGIGLAMFLTIYLGAMWEFGRLVYPALYVVFFGGAQLCLFTWRGCRGWLSKGSVGKDIDI